jgi:peptidoglycan/LPS O-acetylase OafA/YrhL
MFGFFRTMLALWVMIFHLLDIPIIGPYAVFSFFSLSGFLMTTIMHESYGYDHSGKGRYALNRFLRLYPMYWLAIILSIIVIIYVTPEYSIAYKNVLYIPNNFADILFNTIMIFPNLFPDEVSPRLSPPTWALTIEIFYYVCIGLGISKTKKLTLTWVSLSFAYYVLTYVFNMGGAHRYFSIFAGTLPFSLGSLLYFYKTEIYSLLCRLKISNPLFLLALYILSAAFFTLNKYYKPFPNYHYDLNEAGKYINIFFTLLVIVSLFFRGHEIFSKKVDKFIGDYSYPIYLLQWQLGLIASFILFKTPTRGLSSEGFSVFILSLLLVFIISSILIYSMDRHISFIRNKIKTYKANRAGGTNDEDVPDASIFTTGKPHHQVTVLEQVE